MSLSNNFIIISVVIFTFIPLFYLHNLLEMEIFPKHKPIFNEKRRQSDECNCTQGVITAETKMILDLDVSKFCPQGQFVGNDEKYEVGNGVTLCGDQIIYGYDLMFEKQKLFALNTWLGVPNQQDPQDAMVLAELISQEKPDVIIELGTNEGGGALFYASIMELIDKGMVITMDTRDFRTGGWIGNPRCNTLKCIKANESPIWNKRVKFIQGLPQQNLEAVKELTANLQKVWVIEDSSHIYQDVMTNLESFSQFVTPGGLLLVQDTKLKRFVCGVTDCPYRNAPMDAVFDFMALHKGEYIMDRSLEYFRYTQHAMGWLRKVTNA